MSQHFWDYHLANPEIITKQRRYPIMTSQLEDITGPNVSPWWIQPSIDWDSPQNWSTRGGHDSDFVDSVLKILPAGRVSSDATFFSANLGWTGKTEPDYMYIIYIYMNMYMYIYDICYIHSMSYVSLFHELRWQLVQPAPFEASL